MSKNYSKKYMADGGEVTEMLPPKPVGWDEADERAEQRASSTASRQTEDAKPAAIKATAVLPKVTVTAKREKPANDMAPTKANAARMTGAAASKAEVGDFDKTPAKPTQADRDAKFRNDQSNDGVHKMLRAAKDFFTPKVREGNKSNEYYGLTGKRLTASDDPRVKKMANGGFLGGFASGATAGMGIKSEKEKLGAYKARTDKMGQQPVNNIPDESLKREPEAYANGGMVARQDRYKK
jgi:hypothetical protein